MDASVVDNSLAAGWYDLQRAHPDPYAADRPPLTVDRQRIIHSSAFRRLQYKTQVFVSRQGDHFRSRLTHTLEVANLARCVAERLRLNAELAEVVALAHDLGHPPFGHAGERALDECLRRHSDGEGFEHNLHSLRVVEYLEHPYPEFRGLNLTAAVRQCLATHSTPYDRPDAQPAAAAPLEGRAVALADRLAYALHDLQDGLYAGLLEPADVEGLELWRETYSGPRPTRIEDCRRHLRPTVERMQALLLDDAAEEFSKGTASRPQPEERGTVSRSRAIPPPATERIGRPAGRGGLEPGNDTAGVRFTPRGEALLAPLCALLHERVYRDGSVVRMDSKARRIVCAIFSAYASEPQLMPRRFAERVAEQRAARVAVDYIAGMTDRFCQEEYARLFDARMEA